MKLYQTSAEAEQERIFTTFQSGYSMCKASLFTFLHALIIFMLVLVHIMTFIINFTIGVLVIAHAVVCMMRLLLVQSQALTENSMNTVERGNKR